MAVSAAGGACDLGSYVQGPWPHPFYRKPSAIESDTAFNVIAIQGYFR